MIVTRSDIEEFEARYFRYADAQRTKSSADSDREQLRFYRWLTNNPQVLMCAGFQEYIGAHTLPLYQRLVRRKELIPAKRPVFRTYRGRWVLLSHMAPDCDMSWDGYSVRALEGLPRNPSEEAWDRCVIDLPSFNSIVDAASRIHTSPLLDATSFVSPQLWTPDQQDHEKRVLQTSTAAVMRALQQERIELQSISPRLFEEIVGEILRRQGMEIHVVRETPQGGRDIVARGELVPGLEALTIAVEVKHKRVVNRPEVQMALQQNRRFPALLFVTSGRFSAGVLEEASLPEHRMRLFLEDGVAIGEILRTFKL